MNRMQLHAQKMAAILLAALGFWSISGAVSGTVMAQGASGKAVESGKVEFSKYCAACHGTDAKGTGPLAKLLTVKVPDLTLVYKRNKGVFPIAVVVDIVEGDYPIASHGGREMPLWGDSFRSEGKTNQEARGRILDIVLYLHSIQAK